MVGGVIRANFACDASSALDSKEKREESENTGQGFQTELIKKFLFSEIAEFSQGTRQESSRGWETNLVV